MGYFAATVLVHACRRYFHLWGKCDVCWAEAPWAAPKRKLLLGLFLVFVPGSGMLLWCCPVTDESQIHLVALFCFLSRAAKGAFHGQGSWYTQLLLIFNGLEYVILFCNIFIRREEKVIGSAVFVTVKASTDSTGKENTKCFQLF